MSSMKEQILQYAKQKQSTDEGFFCAHMIMERLGIGQKTASALLSMLVRDKRLVTCSAKYHCDSSNIAHTFYSLHPKEERQETVMKYDNNSLEIKIPDVDEFKVKVLQLFKPLPKSFIVLALKKIMQDLEDSI